MMMVMKGGGEGRNIGESEREASRHEGPDQYSYGT